jgi:hypothetical protein
MLRVWACISLHNEQQGQQNKIIKKKKKKTFLDTCWLNTQNMWTLTHGKSE